MNKQYTSSIITAAGDGSSGSSRLPLSVNIIHHFSYRGIFMKASKNNDKMEMDV